MAEDRPRQLHLKFFALNANFRNLSLNLPSLRRSTQAAIKEGYPLGKWLFYRY